MPSRLIPHTPCQEPRDAAPCVIKAAKGLASPSGRFLMPSFQFCLYEVSVRQFQKKDTRRPVAEFNSRRHDLFNSLQDFMNDKLGAKGVSLQKTEHYIRLQKIEDKSRVLWSTVESGKFGNTGIVVATDTGDNEF